MLSRRDMVGKLAAGAAAVWVAGAAKASLASTPPAQAASAADRAAGLAGAAQASSGEKRAQAAEAAPRSTTTASAPAPWELLGPLTLGAAVAHGWHVAAFSGADDGACVLTLANERGRSHRVHLCRNDGRPQGLVFTKQFDLVVMNGGQGDLPTDEGFAQAIAEVAHVLAVNETDRRQGPVVAALLPHAERLQRYQDEARLR